MQTARRAERAAEQAGVEEKLKALQAQSMNLMQQLKVAQTNAPLTSPMARQPSGNPAPQGQASDRQQQQQGGGWMSSRQTMGPPGGYSGGGGGGGRGAGRGRGGFRGGYAGGHMQGNR